MPDTEDLVSVIIPAYNAERFISETIQNILTQDYSPIEVIIVNDGSTDNTKNIILGFQSDSRIKYIHQSNMGCSGAKNTGLASAKGRFIQFLDADDLLSKGKISEQVKVLTEYPNVIAVCRTKVFHDDVLDPSNAELDSEFLYSTDNSLEFVLNLYGLHGKNGMIQPNAFMISRMLAQQIGPYDRSISPSPDEDGEYFCRAMLSASAIRFTEKEINYYRKQLNSRHSLSKQVSYPYAKGALKSIELITKHLLARENSIRVRKIMAAHFANFIYLYSLYTDLVELAEKKIYALGIQCIPPTGGQNFRKMSRLIGFHNALKLKNLIGSFKKPVAH